VDVQDTQSVEVFFQQVALAIWPDLTAKIGQLLGYLSERLIKLDVFALDGQYTTALWTPC
jgi:hypothetical protein